MFKKITILVVLLVVVGVSLTLYLPAYQSNNRVSDNLTTYQIDQPSLKTPLLMTDTLLPTVALQDSLYGLRLGMFGQLQQAINQGKKYRLADDPTIFKTTDEQRLWYLLVLGPYSSKEDARGQGLLLQKNHDISTTLIQWPLNNTE